MNEKTNSEELEGIVQQNVDNVKLRKMYGYGSISSAIVGVGSVLASNYIGSENSTHFPLMIGATVGLAGTVLLGFGALYHHAQDMLQKITIQYPLDSEDNGEGKKPEVNISSDNNFMPRDSMRYGRFGGTSPLEFEERNY